MTVDIRDYLLCLWEGDCQEQNSLAELQQKKKPYQGNEALGLGTSRSLKGNKCTTVLDE
jgi:hypothetical protein